MLLYSRPGALVLFVLGLLAVIVVCTTIANADNAGSSIRGHLLDALAAANNNRVAASDQAGCYTSGFCFTSSSCCQPAYQCSIGQCKKVCSMTNENCALPCCGGLRCDPMRGLCIPITAAPSTMPPTTAPTPRNCTVLPQTDSVRVSLGYLESNSSTCGDYLDAVDDVVDPIADGASKIKTAFSLSMSATQKIINLITDLLDQANQMPFKGLLQIIPPPFKTIVQVLLKAADLALKTVNSILEKLGKFVSAIDKLAKGLKALNLGLKASEASFKAQAAIADGFNSMEGTAIGCVLATTETCSDNDVLENTNKDFKKTVDSALSTAVGCVQTYDQIKTALQKLKDAIMDPIIQIIADIVDLVLAAVQQIIDQITEIYNKIKEKLKEAYCCGTPYPLQVSGTALGLTLDLITCPLQGILDSIETAIANQVDKLILKMQDGLNKFIQPMKNLVANASLPNLQVSNGSIDACVLRLPGLQVTYVNPFQEFLDWTFDPVAIKYTPSLWGKIKEACKAAVNAFDDSLAEDCCKPYHPLNDGDFCDPSGTIGYKHCTQCVSKSNNYWPSKVYRACGKQSPCWTDGTLCARGTTCDACCNSPTYWYSKVMDACGVEPRWEDGKACADGSTCNACKNKATYWWGKAFTACGNEPKWGDGTLCGSGTTCNACQNAATYWYSKGLTACGREPCWGDGTTCASGTTCKACCNGYNYWYSKGFTKCGKEPCWGDGSACAAGTSCNACCNSYSFWSSKAFTACGKEPCWGDGTICALGTSCGKCCNSAGYWYGNAATCCGREPCWGGGTWCLKGTSCNRCCSGSSYNWRKVSFYCN